MPQRIQRRRTKGWRMPPDAIYVGRPSRWGNEFEVGSLTRQQAVDAYAVHLASYFGWEARVVARAFRPLPVESTAFRDWLAPLRGHALACWCPLEDAAGNALTLWQPYATLVVRGIKRFESRSWAYRPWRNQPGRELNSRGEWERWWRMERHEGGGTILGPKPIPLAIHAGATFDEPFAVWLRDVVGCLDTIDLQTKAMVGTVSYVGAHPAWSGSQAELGASDLEVELGDWTPGRWLWEFASPVEFAEPVPMKGQQGVWSWLAPDYIGLERAVAEKVGR